MHGTPRDTLVGVRGRGLEVLSDASGTGRWQRICKDCA